MTSANYKHWQHQQCLCVCCQFNLIFYCSLTIQKTIFNRQNSSRISRFIEFPWLLIEYKYSNLYVWCFTISFYSINRHTYRIRMGILIIMYVYVIRFLVSGGKDCETTSAVHLHTNAQKRICNNYFSESVTVLFDIMDTCYMNLLIVLYTFTDIQYRMLCHIFLYSMFIYALY